MSTLFDTPAGVRDSDPRTSMDQAHDETNQLRWSSQNAKVLLSFQGRPGLTAEAAGDLAGVKYPGGHRRCSDLLKLGYLERTDDVIDGQHVLRITPAGEAALRGAK